MDDVRERPSSSPEPAGPSSDERRERHCEHCGRPPDGIVLPGGRRLCEPCARCGTRAVGGLYCWAGPGDGGRPPDVR